MDFLYVAKRVPYPLTVEVYGGGGYGKLQQGALKQLAKLCGVALLWFCKLAVHCTSR
jgi:hypothetical protein